MIKKIRFCQGCGRKRTLHEIFNAKFTEFNYQPKTGTWKKRVYRFCSACWYVHALKVAKSPII